MLLQTNSYIVPKDKRTEHARLLQRFKQLLAKHGCDHFEAYEQVGANWSGAEPTGRFVQIMRFRDRQQWLAVQQEEKNDPQAKQLIQEFCELINLPYQMQAGLFAAVYFNGVITQHMQRPVTPPKPLSAQAPAAPLVETESHSETPEPPPEHASPSDEPMGTTLDATSPDDSRIPDDPPSIEDLAEAGSNGEPDVLDFLNDPEPTDTVSEESQRQRID